MMEHPAKFGDKHLYEFARILDAECGEDRRILSVLDPFAGVGTIHKLHKHMPWIETLGVELEPEWANLHPQTIVGDATDLPCDTWAFDAVCTSPAYGNRMADKYDGRDGSTRRTYRTALGRDLADKNGGGMQWGQDYRHLHSLAVSEMLRVVKPGGLIVVNMKNHVRKGEVERVVEWWLSTFLVLDCTVEEVTRLALSGYGYGANREARVGAEHFIVVRTPR